MPPKAMEQKTECAWMTRSGFIRYQIVYYGLPEWEAGEAWKEAPKKSRFIGGREVVRWLNL